MSEILTKAAIAAADHYGLKWEDLPEVNPVANGELDRRHFLENAEVVLRAARDAEDLAALVAGKEALYCCTEDPELEHARACWHAMFDTALPQPIMEIPVSMGREVIKGEVRWTMPFASPLTDHFASEGECVGRIRMTINSDGEVVDFYCIAAEDGLLIMRPGK
jgi:hypothetical protein